MSLPDGGQRWQPFYRDVLQGLHEGDEGSPVLSGEAGSMSKPWSGRPSSSWTLSKSLATHALESPSRPSKCKSWCRSRPNTSVISLRPVWSCKRVGSSNIEMSSGVAVSLEGSSWTMWLCVTMCHCVCFFPNPFLVKVKSCRCETVRLDTQSLDDQYSTFRK